MPTPENPHATPAARLTQPLQRSPQFEQAIDLALQGFAVFPLRAGAKVPLIERWEQAATTDPRHVARWWTRYPSANIAIACGPSNLLVVDLDPAKKPNGPRHGHDTLTTLANGREIPRTFTVTSARGGRHLYFHQPDDATLRNTTGSERAGLGPLIDTRGHGGYVVAPGSTFQGGTYRIEDDAAIAAIPTWIVAELAARKSRPTPTATPSPTRIPITDRRRSAYGNAALRRSADAVATAPEGTRNDTLNREAFRLGRLVGGAILDREDAATTLRRAALKAGLPPAEIENTITSGLTAGSSRPHSIPDRALEPRTNNPPKEITMATVTTHVPQTAQQAVAAPPDAADLYPQLSAPGSQAFQNALRILWRLGPTAIGLPETNAEPIRAAWQEAGKQMATAIQENEPATPNAQAESASAALKTAPINAATPTPPPETATPTDPATSPEADIDFDFEDIWADVRASIERARQALPDWSDLSTPDDLQPAIDEALRYLAQAPIPRHDQSHSDNTSATGSGDEYSTEAPTEELTQYPADELDAHLAAVDVAYDGAQSVGIPHTTAEWAGIHAIHAAVHNLWDTIKAAAGTYWVELAADTRIHGLLTTLATRATRAIATLATAATDRLEQRTMQQAPSPAPAEPGLREAYINARNHIRSHATSHEWQRITALWGTVNTLTRQTDDPGIRSVVARSADAISDFAETLGRKTAQFDNQGNVTDALKTLARAAELHATTLRSSHTVPEQQDDQPQPHLAPNTATVSPTAHPSANAQALQASARQVAQHAQARLGQGSPTPTPSRHPRSTIGLDEGVRPMQPPTHGLTRVQVRPLP